MSSAYEGFKGDDYANASAQRRGLERSIAKNGHLTILPAREVIKPEPDPEWHQAAKEMWVLSSVDEATDTWSSSDWLRLKMLCETYSAERNGTYADGTPRAPRAQVLEVLFAQMTELRLSARAKQQDGFLIDRSGEPVGDEGWLNNALKGGVLDKEDDEDD